MRNAWPSLLTCLLSFFLSPLIAQQDLTKPSIPLDPLDSIIIVADPMSNNLEFNYVLPAGTSLYAAGRQFGLSMDDVYLLNPKFRLGYSVGDEMRVPLPRPAIRSYIPYDSINFYCPVYYEFRRGETLYGLIHRSLKLEDEQVLYINNPGLSAETLFPGQLLFIGWLSVAGITDEMQGAIEDPYIKSNTGLREAWNSISANKRLTTQKGKAAWTREGDRSKFMALHRTAPINSLIEIMDKRTGKILYCRVVGRIPDQVYDPNVQVVVSPLLVKAFGVRDRFFYVQVKHY